MKVITIKQPFATLIAEGLKEYEFRSWKTTYKGEIFIHAGLGVEKEAMKRFEYLHLEYPKGCIIAKANLTECIEIDDEMKKKLKEKDEIVYRGAIQHKGKNEYGFHLENIEKIEPILTKGQLGLWNYPKEKEL